MNWMLQKNSPELKEKIWNTVIDGRQRFFAKLFEDNPKSLVFMKLSKLEFEGGACWTCGTHWIEQYFNNPSLAGKYYVPNCDCFVTCPICETPLYDLQFQEKKLTRCDNCHFRLHDPIKKLKRYGRDFKYLYDTSTEYRKHKMRIEKFNVKNE